MKSDLGRGLLLSDFTMDVLKGNLSPITHSDVQIGPFGNVIPVMMDLNHACFTDNLAYILVWSQIDSVVESFKHVLNGQHIREELIESQVDSYCKLIVNISSNAKYIFIPSFTIPVTATNFDVFSLNKRQNPRQVLNLINDRMTQNFDSYENIFVMDAQSWFERAGKDALNFKLWYMAKIPYSTEIFQLAAQDITNALKSLSGQNRRLIVLDLDDTLWGGIVGDDGYENLKLGGHDPIGEAFVNFQQRLKELKNQGVILAIASKNEESVALEAMELHPEMILRKQDFSAWRINWDDKAQNILDIVKELNIGLQSVVFIDDNKVERERVREALPEVLVPDWPLNKLLYSQALIHLRCFDTPTVSREDRDRSLMYAQENLRKQSATSMKTLDDWIKNLEIVIDIEKLSKDNLARTTQLLNKTNQMNLTTRRMSEKELLDWSSLEENAIWTLRVKDKFGDAGLTGIVGLSLDSQKVQIVDFVLSCRVMGRKIEETMLFWVNEQMKKNDVKFAEAIYKKTEKNKPCFDFFKKSKLTNKDDISFMIEQQMEVSMPEGLTLNILDKTIEKEVVSIG